MRKGILSTIIAVIGLYFVYWFNRKIRYSLANVESLVANQNTVELSLNAFMFKNVYQITSVSIGLISLYIGIMAIKKIKIRRVY